MREMYAALQPGKRKLALADPGGLARGVEPPADGHGIIVMRRSGALEDHRGHDGTVGTQVEYPACEDREVELDLGALFRPGGHPSGWRRMPAVAAEAMIATSHPLATAAGLEAFEAGGNAVDAALAAATILAVVEPTDNGLGGDAFALVWREGALHGLNGSGRAPGVVDELRVDETGPRSVTVPGAVRAWVDLAERFGRLGLDRALGRAADRARRGVACSARIADKWARAPEAPFPAPRVGERFVIPGLADTLASIAAEK